MIYINILEELLFYSFLEGWFVHILIFFLMVLDAIMGPKYM